MKVILGIIIGLLIVMGIRACAPPTNRSYLSRITDPHDKSCWVNYGSDAVHCPGKEKQRR